MTLFSIRNTYEWQLVRADVLMYYCYVLRCADGTFYTGITTDLTRRLQEHNGGRGCRYTACRRPVRLAWKEEHPNRSSAQRREAEIKRLSRTKKKTLIEG